MIIITKVETITVDRDPHEILHTAGFDQMVWPCDGEAPVEAEVFSELIHGMRWRWRDAREEIDVTVGITGEAEKILNMGYGIMENLRKQIHEQEDTNGRLEGRLREAHAKLTYYRTAAEQMKESTFMQRLRWLFKGVRI